jgi:hypothetical protein
VNATRPSPRRIGTVKGHQFVVKREELLLSLLTAAGNALAGLLASLANRTES